MAKKKEPPEEFQIPVKFGNVSFGDTTARLSATASRPGLSTSRAEKYLCGKRLKVELFASTETEEQKSLPGAETKYTMTITGDVAGYGVRPKKIGFGLTLNLGDLTDQERAELQRFARLDGKLTIKEVSAAKVDDESEEVDE